MCEERGSKRKEFLFIKIKLIGRQRVKKVCGKCAEKWIKSHEKASGMLRGPSWTCGRSGHTVGFGDSGPGGENGSWK